MVGDEGTSPSPATTVKRESPAVDLRDQNIDLAAGKGWREEGKEGVKKIKQNEEDLEDEAIGGSLALLSAVSVIFGHRKT
jgi:hypothetical protein